MKIAKKNKCVEPHLNVISSDLSETESSSSTSIEKLKEKYSDTIHIKERLEDKAKTNAAGVTISITLILGAPNFLSIIGSKFDSLIAIRTFAVLFIMAAIYITASGISAFIMLMHVNTISILPIHDKLTDYAELRGDICSCISCNQKMNTIRNNYVYASYGCVRNALLCLLIVLVLSTIPIFNTGSKSSIPHAIAFGNTTYSFYMHSRLSIMQMTTRCETY